MNRVIPIRGRPPPRKFELCRGQAIGPPEEMAQMFQLDSTATLQPPDFALGCQLRSISADELTTAVRFAVQAIQCHEGWVHGYFDDLIHKQELFGLWSNEQLIATGECRVSQLQPPCADVGMVVSPDHRGQGHAANILRWLVQQCWEKGLNPICSTESGNLAAQRAIRNAGFVAYHRIMKFQLA